WDPARLRAWVRQNVEDYWADWVARAQRPWGGLGLLRGGTVAWGVLGIGRMLYTLRTGEVTSKSGAGQWMPGVVEPQWREIVEEALRIRRTGRGGMGSLRRRRDALGFMTMVLELIRAG
ncbi:MAG: DUF4111 domain-containing protein, partial [Sphingomonadales bacterium]